MDDEALVAEFMEATGCGREDAFDRLASSGGHLGRAINSFFSIDAGPSSARSRSRSPRPSSPHHDTSSSEEEDAVRAPPVPARRIMVSRWDSDTKPIVVGRSKSSRRRERRRRNRSRGGIGTANTSIGGDRAAADGNRGRRRRFREFREDIFSDAEEDEEEKETNNNSRSRRRLNPPTELITPKGEKKKAAADDDSSRHLVSFRDEDVVNVSSDEDNMLEELDEAPRRPPPARNRTFEELFKVPRGLTFKGGFHAAKVHAARRQRWLLANVQSSDDLPLPSLHQNRDVWGNDLVAQCVRDRFVLWHADVDADVSGQGENEARKVLGYYGIPRDQLPVVLVVDPVTGQAMDVLHGSAACEFNDFMVRLGPHTETKPVVPVVMAKKSTTNASSSAGAQLSSTRPATASTTITAPTSSERAAVSRQQQAPTTTTTVMRQQPDSVVPAVAPTCQTRQEQAVTTTSVTPEPAVAPCTGQGQPQPESVEEKLCTVRVRLADGRAVTKEFGSQCAVAELFAYCRSTLDAGGAPPERPFRLLRFVGRATEEIGDQNASFESLGLHLTTVSVHLG